MKKIVSFFLVLLTACQTMLPMSDDQVRKFFPPSMEVFEFSNRCPHICWLGINPGLTTAGVAVAILRASNQIDPKRLQVSDASISAVWFAGRVKTYPCNVKVRLERGLVTSITYDRLPFTLYDFVDLVGEPNEINIGLQTGPDQAYIQYWVYYLEKKIFIAVSPGSRNGPDPSDRVGALILNLELDKSNYLYGDIQPWLGYHHLQDYMPGTEIPPLNNPIGP
jgi:hypothetical protein